MSPHRKSPGSLLPGPLCARIEADKHDPRSKLLGLETWLPGDARGFRTRHHPEHIEGDYKHPPPKGKYAARHEHAKNLMKRDPVFLSVEQRLLIVRLMVESLQKS